MLAFGTVPPTIGYSCSSTVAGAANDGVDRWATTANIVQNGAGLAHSWFVFKFPNGFQYLWSFNQASSTPNKNGIGFYCSPAAGFTGGTTTADPTATDQYTIITSAVNTLINIAADAAIKWNVMLSTDGTCMNWFFLSAGAVVGSLFLGRLANLTGGTPGATDNGWGLGGGAGAAFALNGNTRSNGTNTATSLAYESVANLSIASEISGGFDVFPVSLVGTTVGVRGKLGTIQDIWLTSSGIALGDGNSNGTVNSFMNLTTVANVVTIPWNTTVLLLT